VEFFDRVLGAWSTSSNNPGPHEKRERGWFDTSQAPVKIRLDLLRDMELDSIECVSYSDGMEDDDDTAAVTSSQLPRPFLKSSSTAAAAAAAAAVNVVVVSDRAGAAGTVAGAGPLVISPATGVHELLECPVCTNSMYPPIHQVRTAQILFVP
jgi:hypothetical protein